MKSLQQITDAWGNWYSSKNGTTCRFTAGTNYGSQSFLAKYHQYQTNVTILGIEYDGNSPPVGGSTTAYELWYDNGTQLQQQESFSKTDSLTVTLTLAITEALSIGVEVSATEGVPAVASATEKITIAVNFSSTQTFSASRTQSWQVNSPINVPPMSSVKADMVISSQSYDIKFTKSVILQGYVAIWNNDKVNGHWLWFLPIESVFQDCINNNIIDTSGYSIVNGGVQTQATGVFTGSQGISVGVTATQYPLRNSVSETPIKSIETPTVNLLAFPANDE